MLREIAEFRDWRGSVPWVCGARDRPVPREWRKRWSYRRGAVGCPKHPERLRRVRRWPRTALFYKIEASLGCLAGRRYFVVLRAPYISDGGRQSVPASRVLLGFAARSLRRPSSHTWFVGKVRWWPRWEDSSRAAWVPAMVVVTQGRRRGETSQWRLQVRRRGGIWNLTRNRCTRLSVFSWRPVWSAEDCWSWSPVPVPLVAVSHVCCRVVQQDPALINIGDLGCTREREKRERTTRRMLQPRSRSKTESEENAPAPSAWETENDEEVPTSFS